MKGRRPTFRNRDAESRRAVLEVVEALAEHGEDASSEIKRAQEKLRDLGLYHGNIDGVLGPATVVALNQFQKKDGLNIDITPLLTGVATEFGRNWIVRDFQQWLDLLTTPAQRRQQQQRPAAYRFELRDAKIGVLPEPPEPRDREFAVDTYDELVAKARELFARLSGTNSAQRLCNSVERLLSVLGNRFDDLRPGLLLSRSRSIEADRAAFADELFPDALALMDDTLQTLRDLLAAFPIVRVIEAEGLALQLDRNTEAIPAIQQEMDAVQAVAAQSGAVAEDALNALAQNDAAIADTTDPVARTGLIADKLLVVGNFARAVLHGIASYGRIAKRELSEVAGTNWRAIKDNLPMGTAAAAKVAPLVGLVTLAAVIAGPYATIAAAVQVFKPIGENLRKLTADTLKDAGAGDVKGDRKKAKGRGKNR